MVIAPQTPYRGRLQTLDYTDDVRPRERSEPLLLMRRLVRSAPVTGLALQTPIIVDKRRLAEVMTMLTGLQGRAHRAASPGPVPALAALARRERERRHKRRTMRASLYVAGIAALVVAAFLAGVYAHQAPQWLGDVAGAAPV